MKKRRKKKREAAAFYAGRASPLLEGYVFRASNDLQLSFAPSQSKSPENVAECECAGSLGLKAYEYFPQLSKGVMSALEFGAAAL